MSSKRLFIACPIRHPTVEAEISSTWKALKGIIPAGASPPTREPLAHITLRFLGDVEVGTEGSGTSQTVRERTAKELLRRLILDLDEITGEFTKIPLTLGPLGLFPQGVAWCSIDGDQDALLRLHQLQERVDAALKLPDWPYAAYPFLPHVTVGRFDRSLAAKVADLLEYQDYPQPVDFEVGSIEVLESVRGPFGVEYVPFLPPFLFSDVRAMYEDPRASR